MLIALSTFSCTSAYVGNEIRETMWFRLNKRSEEEWPSSNGEDMSPNESKPASASLHYKRRLANLPEMAKPDTNGEVKSICIHWTDRGDWGERVSKGCDRSRETQIGEIGTHCENGQKGSRPKREISRLIRRNVCEVWVSNENRHK